MRFRLFLAAFHPARLLLYSENYFLRPIFCADWVPGWVALLFRAFVFAALALLFGLVCFCFCLLRFAVCFLVGLVACWFLFCFVVGSVFFSAFLSCELAVPSSTCLRLLSHLYAFLTLYSPFISPY